MNGELAERPSRRPYGLPDKGFTRRVRPVARSVPRIVVQPWARTETELVAMAEGLFRSQAQISPKYFYEVVCVKLCKLVIG